MTIVLILGSGPSVTRCRDWPRDPFDRIVAINNAWAVRTDWDDLIHPEDFPIVRRPPDIAANQRIVTAADYVSVQNQMGGFVYAGGTMAFTAAYWALGALQPRVIAMLGCDMVYSATSQTHFYGTGEPDPLRQDVTLRNLEAKSARLMITAADQGCAMVNLSTDESRLVFPRVTPATAPDAKPQGYDTATARAAREMEDALGYMDSSGRYWEDESRYDTAKIDLLDALWLKAIRES